jgi:type II secretory ATPase GspE/PulE/Tfp pilus assembly ATPase PilB-like protein
VHPKIGLTFAQSLRSILRHDPDVVLVGEIRDLETAENAIQASLTGHLVFSTLHTNDAAGAYTRLDRHGRRAVPGGQHGRSGDGPAARLCKHCKQPIRPAQGDLPPDFPWERLGNDQIFQQLGCRECRNTGYRGRLGIYELLVTTDEIREFVHARASSWKVREAALNQGMITLRQDGWRKMILGDTSSEEVLMVTKGDYIRRTAS